MKLTTRIIAARLNEAAAQASPCVRVTPVHLPRAFGTATPQYRPAGATECACDKHDRFTLRFGSLVVSCLDGADHIRAVAAKYERGTKSLRARAGLPARELPGKPSLRRPVNADALLAELLAECGEVEPETLAREAA